MTDEGNRDLPGFQESISISSFEDLFRGYYHRMKKYACYFLKDEEEANDLIQNVFLQYWSNRHTMNNRKNEAAWLFKSLKNGCLNQLKHRIIEGKYSREQSFFETERLYHISFEQDTGFISMADYLSLELESIIGGMPEKCGQAFRMKWLEGKKIKEIAELMDISTTMVDKHLSRGMEIARQKIRRESLILLSFLK